MWKNNVELGRPQMTVRCMRIAFWILKATNTHSEYVILIDYPLQQWLQKCTSMLRYTYIAHLASICRLSIINVMNKVCQKTSKYVCENKHKKSCLHIIIKFFECHKFQSTLTFSLYRNSLLTMLELIKAFHHICQVLKKYAIKIFGHI